jgi:hypothetical protein
MTVVGGLRARFLSDSFFNLISDSLDDLDWFNSEREHEPLRVLPEPQDLQNPIMFNTIAISMEDEKDIGGELGSNLTETQVTFYIEIFCESEALLIHLSRDLKDILGGRYVSIGRVLPSFPIYDYRQATPEIIAYAQINRIDVDKPRDFGQPWLKHWRIIRVLVEDTYGR